MNTGRLECRPGFARDDEERVSDVDRGFSAAYLCGIGRVEDAQQPGVPGARRSCERGRPGRGWRPPIPSSSTCSIPSSRISRAKPPSSVDQSHCVVGGAQPTQPACLALSGPHRSVPCPDPLDCAALVPLRQLRLDPRLQLVAEREGPWAPRKSCRSARSMARTFSSRRLWRSSPLKVAPRKLSRSSRASARPITREPITRTLTSSCSTP